MIEFDSMLKAVVQFGFAGLCVVLLCILIWALRRQFDQAEKLTEVIKENTQGFIVLHEATIAHVAVTNELLRLDRQIHDKLLARPCIAKGEHAG